MAVCSQRASTAMEFAGLVGTPFVQRLSVSFFEPADRDRPSIARLVSSLTRIAGLAPQGLHAPDGFHRMVDRSNLMLYFLIAWRTKRPARRLNVATWPADIQDPLGFCSTAGRSQRNCYALSVVLVLILILLIVV
jgi:hypothetical protein